MGDIRMIQRRENFGFALESRNPLSVVGDVRREHLQRDLALQHGVGRAIHLAHTARPKNGDDFVRSKSRPSGQRHHRCVGTRAFSSSNQLRTTWICGAAGIPVAPGKSAATTPRSRPSWVMSLLRSYPGPRSRKLLSTGTGLPNANDGCVVTLTANS